jgi:hypothetical protein
MCYFFLPGFIIYGTGVLCLNKIRNAFFCSPAVMWTVLTFILYVDFNVTAQVLDMVIVITWRHSQCSGQFATVRQGQELEVRRHLVDFCHNLHILKNLIHGWKLLWRVGGG